MEEEEFGTEVNDDSEAIAEESADQVTTTFFERFKKNFNEAVYGMEGPKEGETTGGKVAAGILSPIDTGKALAKAFVDSPGFKTLITNLSVPIGKLKEGLGGLKTGFDKLTGAGKETGIRANIRNQLSNILGPLAGGIKNAVAGALDFLGGARLVGLEVAVRGLAAAAQKLVQTLNEINDIDERLAVINSNLAAEMQGNTQALADNTLGFGMAMKSLAELRIAGFDQTNTNLIDLVSRLQISGQDTGAAINLAQTLIGTGNMQEAAVDRLAQTMIESSKAFGTSMDSVVKAVGSLSENIQRLSLMGGAETTTQITAQLTSMLGPENAQMVGRVMKELTSISGDFQMQAILGLEGIGDSVATGNATVTDFIQAITTAAGNAESMVGGSAQESRRVLAATFGGSSQLVLDILSFTEKLKEASEKQLKQQDSLLTTLTAFKTIILDPFKDVVSGMLPAFKMLVGGLSYAIAGILNLVVRVFSPLINLVMYVGGAVLGLIGAAADVLGGIVEFVYDILSKIPLIGDLFKDADSDKIATFNNMTKIMELVTGTSDTNVEAASIMQGAAKNFATMKSMSFENNALVAQTLISSTNSNEQVLNALASIQKETLKIEQEKVRQKELERIEKVGLERNSSVQTEAAIRFLDTAARSTTEVTDQGLESALSRIFGEGVTNIVDELKIVSQTMRDKRLSVENKDI